MELSDQICSLELAKKLKELGVKQESLFWYTIYVDQTYDIHYQFDSKYIPPAHYAAFTVAELGEMLPVFSRAYNELSIINLILTNGM